MTAQSPELILLEYLQPNPYQPRHTEDPDHIRDLAISIASDGLLQTPIGRRTADGDIQLAAGHSRLAAFKLLASTQIDGVDPADYIAIPVVVRDLDDEQMFRIAVAENVQRRDLSPVEVARAMLRYRDEFGKTSAEIGDLFGLSDSAVRNKIRLLGLPEDLLGDLEAGNMSEGAGRVLLQLFDVPEPVRVKAEKDYSWNRKSPSDIIARARAGAQADDLAKDLEDMLSRSGIKLSEAGWKWDQVFEGEGIHHPDCKTCPLNQKVGKHNLCLDPGCFKTKQRMFERAYLETASQESGIAISPEEKSHHDMTALMTHSTDKGTLKLARKGNCSNLCLAYASSAPEDYNKNTRLDGFPHAQIYCVKRAGHCTCDKAVKAGVKIAPTNGELSEAGLKEVRAEINQGKRDKQLITKGMIDEAHEKIRAALEAQEFKAIRGAISHVDYRFGKIEDPAELWSELASHLIQNKSGYANRDEVYTWRKNMNTLLEALGLDKLGTVSAETVVAELLPRGGF